MKEYINRNKTYKIDQRGIVYQEDGVTVTSDIVIYHNHYYLNSVPLHRIVYNLYVGEYKKGMVIHHQNTNSRDNRPQNLIQLTKEQHKQVHKQLKENPQLKQELLSHSISFFYGSYTKNNKKYTEHNREYMRKYCDYKTIRGPYKQAGYGKWTKQTRKKYMSEYRKNNKEKYKRYRNNHNNKEKAG